MYQRQDAHATAVSDGDSRTFTRLLNRLVGDVLRLLDQKVALLKLELKEDVAAIARRSGLMVAGAALALLGSVLLLLALAIWLGELVGSMPGGFAILGGVLALVGAILVMTMRKRLTEGPLVPEQTVQELRRDAQWIKHEL
ncbi:MAG: phage holin family protein [Candidatus Rokuibacteriota bacterium]